MIGRYILLVTKMPQKNIYHPKKSSHNLTDRVCYNIVNTITGSLASSWTVVK